MIGPEVKLDPYSDFRVQWGDSKSGQLTGKPKQLWSRRNSASKATRQTVGRAKRSCQYQDKSPRPSESRDLRGAEGGAQLTPPANIPIAIRPRHVEQCARNGGRGWSVWVWRFSSPEHKVRIQYTCKSWRCEGDCARAAAAQLFARIKQATEPLPAHEMTFWVLTLDRDGYYSGEPWANAEQAYRALGHMSEMFLKRMRRLCEKNGWGSFRAILGASRRGASLRMATRQFDDSQ